MGCWNKTCGLSNLHIFPNEATYVFILEKVEEPDHCYTTSHYRPLLLPFVSYYNDYGGGEGSTGPAFEIVMNAIRDQLVEMEMGKNQYHDIAVKRDDFGEELFFNAVHEDRLFRHDYRKGQVKLTFTMFRKDIVDHITDNLVLEDYVGDGKGTHGWGNNYVNYKFEDVVASIDPLIATLSAEVDKSFIFDHFWRLSKKNLAAKYMMDDSHRFSRIVDVRILFSKLLAENTPESLEQLKQLMTEHIRGLFVEEFMSSARKTWIPGGHEGSQSESGDALRALYAATISALDREKAEWDAENLSEEELENMSDE